jgi:hypothetical protein
LAQAITQALGHPPVELQEARCPAACSAASRAGALRVVSASTRSAEGAILIVLELLDARNGTALRSVRASGLGLRGAIDGLPAAVQSLFSSDSLSGAPAASATPRASAGGVPAAPDPWKSEPSSSWSEEGARSNTANRSSTSAKKPELDSQQQGGASAPKRNAKSGRVDPAMASLVEEVAADVEKVRGLKRKSQLSYVILSQEEFSKALRRRAKASLGETAAESARWVAFGFARALADPEKITIDDTDDHVLGFYDPFVKKLFVRADQPGPIAALPEDLLRPVLAHEIEHALQDQTFGLGDLTKLGNADEALARKALYEGDAMLTQLAYEAHRAKRPARFVVGTRTAALRRVDTLQLIALNGYSDNVKFAPRIVQEELALPYVSGFGLASDVFRRGGFELINRMFEHAPQSTQQILDPASYLAGARGVQVPQPAGPPGKIVARGRLGALGTKVFLSGCVDPELALEAARAWAGDAYVVTRLGRERLALVWSTAWRDAAAAAVFKNLVEMQRPCWEDAREHADRGELVVDAPFQVVMEGNRVALARGLGDAAAQALANRAVRFSSALPGRSPPLGEQPALLVTDTRDELFLGEFSSKRLGMKGKVPAGLSPVRSSMADFAVSGSGLFGSVAFVAEPATAQSRADLFSIFSGELMDSIPAGEALYELPESATTVLGQPAREHVWKLRNYQYELRIATFEACAGKAFFVVVRSAVDAKALASLAPWLSDLQIESLAPPACADLQ